MIIPVLAGLGALACMTNPRKRKKRRKVRYVFDPISRKRVRVKSAIVRMGGGVKRHRKSRSEVAGVRGPDGVWYRPNPKALDKRWAPASGWAILKRGQRTSGVLYSSREQAEQQLAFLRRGITGSSYLWCRIVKVNPGSRRNPKGDILDVAVDVALWHSSMSRHTPKLMDPKVRARARRVFQRHTRLHQFSSQVTAAAFAVAEAIHGGGPRHEAEVTTTAEALAKALSGAKSNPRRRRTKRRK